MTRKNTWARLAVAMVLCLPLTACKDTKTLQENEQLKAQVAELQKENGQLGNDLETMTAARDAATQENEKLKAEVNQLRQQALLGEAARSQNESLRKQLNFIDSPQFPSDYTAVNTRIIGWRNEFDERVVIAAGRNAGVHQETPVMTNDGLVGSVTQVSPTAALVTLLTDESSAVQARDQNTGATGGIVRHGEGEGSLIVDRITKDKLVKEGDVFVTAGTRSKQYPSLFPPNIPIGYVISVGQSDTAPFKQIQIQPFVDFSSLDAVTALITKKKNPQAP